MNERFSAPYFEPLSQLNADNMPLFGGQMPDQGVKRTARHPFKTQSQTVVGPSVFHESCDTERWFIKQSLQAELHCLSSLGEDVFPFHDRL